MLEVYVARLRELALALPRPGCDWEDRPRFDPPTTTDAVQVVERAAGFPLPDEVKAFFALTDGVVGMSVHNGYHIGGTELIASRIESDDAPREVSDGLAASIAFDGGGNAFRISAVGRVWRWDHETNKVLRVVLAAGK